MAITKIEVEDYLKKLNTERLDKMAFFIDCLVWEREDKLLLGKKATKKASKKATPKANKSNSNYLSPLQGYGN